MKKLMLLLAAMVFCFNTTVSSGQDWTSLASFDLAKLEGQWIVVEIEADGQLSKAQIGQRAGDVITLSTDLNVGFPKIG